MKKSKIEDVNMTLQQLKYVIAIADNNSFNKAARKLFISQPSLSSSVRELEDEMGFLIFNRTNRGIELTTEGKDFIEGARLLMDQLKVLENKSIKKQNRMHFNVSSQHYGFAVKAFSNLIKSKGNGDYKFSFFEEKTSDIIEDVALSRSEIGILFMNDFNKSVIKNSLQKNNLKFYKLKECQTCVMVHKSHPMAEEKNVTEENLRGDYPYISFESGRNSSYYFAEEHVNEKKEAVDIEVSDRACMITLMQELDAYTFCTDISSETIVNKEFVTIPIDTKKKTEVGYIKKNNMELSEIGKLYIEELKKIVIQNS